MALGDYFKGPGHKANAARLEAELQTMQTTYSNLKIEAEGIEQRDKTRIAQLEAELHAHQQQSQTEIHALYAKYRDLEAKAAELRLQEKSNVARLESELHDHRQQSQTSIQALQAKCNDLEAKAEKFRLLGEVNAVRLEAELQAQHDKYNDLEAKAKAIELLDLLAVKKMILSEESKLAKVKERVASAQSELQTSLIQLKTVEAKILGAEDTVLLESFALYEPKYQLTNSVDYKKRLEVIRVAQKNAARSLSAVVDSWDDEDILDVEGEFLTKSEWKKLRKNALKLALRSFNSESEYCIDNVRFSNLEKMADRIRRSFATCNKLLEATDVLWKEGVLEQKLEELYLAHEYQVKRQEEKEALRQAREDQREQEKLEKEIREARTKIEKERRHFTSALQKLQLRLAAANNQQERDDLQTRIGQLTTQNNKLDEAEKLLDYREQNARAGYVYVISNIGAFGEGIYKIGMTRRLEPMDRVDELGDASVPFRFDVHALVFSDNAPALEAKLHSHFAAGRLNKINGRKEFFRADLKQIEAVIRANYDAVVEVVHAAPAEQYRESLRLVMPLESIQIAERIAVSESKQHLIAIT